MTDMADATYCLILTTTGSSGDAEALARGLVERRLAACVQLSQIVSHYRWQGAVERSDEILVLVKSRTDRVDAISDYISAHHTYDTPELIVVPITSGLPEYLRWIDDAVS